jgi:hypothetical protein
MSGLQLIVFIVFWAFALGIIGVLGWQYLAGEKRP